MSRLPLVAACLVAVGCASAPETPLAPLPPPTSTAPPTATPSRPAPPAVGPSVPPRPVTPDAPFRATPPNVDDSTSFAVPAVESFRLANGLRVFVLPQGGQPLAHARFAVARGAHTPVGATAILSAALHNGTSSIDEHGFRRELDQAGARWTESAGVRDVAIDVTCPSPSIGKVLDLIGDAAAAPLLDPAVTARTREQIAAGRARDDNQPAWVARRVAPMALYGEKRPEDQFQSLRPADLRSVKPEDVRLAWKSTFVPSAATLVVVGGTSADELRPIVERAFGRWTGPTVRRAPRAPASVAVRSPRLVVVDRPRAAQASVTWAANVPEPGTRDWPALILANDTLGGAGGGKIGRALKSAGHATWAWNKSFDPAPAGELETWSTEVPFTTLTDTLHLVDEALQSLRETDLTDAEMTNARLSEARSNLSWLASVDRAAGAVSRIPLFNLPVDDLQTEPARIAAVTAADVRRVASTSFDPARMKIVVIGDWSAMKDQLFALGWGPIEIRSADGDVLRVQSAP